MFSTVFYSFHIGILKFIWKLSPVMARLGIDYRNCYSKLSEIDERNQDRDELSW